jgi:polysaccharide biosynthesis protein PslG
MKSTQLTTRAALCAAACAAACALLAATPARAAAPGPKFFATQSWNQPSYEEFRRMRLGGIGTYRLTVNWYNVEHEPGKYDWSRYDHQWALANAAGLKILPTILGTPGWAGKRAGWPPTSGKGRHAYYNFVKRVVRRYGRAAGFVKAYPYFKSYFIPSTAVQVWNEENIKQYWTNGKPNAAQYAPWLALSRKAIKTADPKARVVLGGLPQSKHGISIATYLNRLYGVGGFRQNVDVIAIHTYAFDEKGVVKLASRVRHVMRDHGDQDKPLYITEFGWASNGPEKSPFVKSPEGQAEVLGKAYRALLAKRFAYHIGLLAWFSWRDRPLYGDEKPWWAPYTGLFTSDGYPKPSWSKFASVSGGTPGQGKAGEPQP